MINSIIHNILVGNKIQSVYIHMGIDQNEYSFVEIHKRKDNLEIEDRFVTQDFEELIPKLSKNKPILLTINGQGVVSKKVTKGANYQSKIIFNSDAEDFYWYEYHQNNDMYVSVSRKDLINQELQLFEKEGLSVLDLSLGIFGVISAKPILDIDAIITKDTKLVFENDELISFTKSDYQKQEYTIGEEKIDAQELICFSNTLNYLYPNDLIVSERQLLTVNKEEFTFKKAFNYLGIFTLVFFLSSLLISYLLLDYYKNANHKVQVELGQQNVAYSKLISLEKDKENKEAILKESGLNDSHFLSFYLSEITKEIPQEINLQELSVFPITKKIKPQQRINFINDLVEIKGTVTSIEVFNTWIDVIKKQPWVNNLKIIDFQRQSKNNSFIIKLILKFDV